MSREYVVVHKKTGVFGKLRSMFTDNGSARVSGQILDLVMDNGAVMARFPVKELAGLTWESAVTTDNFVMTGAGGVRGVVRGLPREEGRRLEQAVQQAARSIARDFEKEVAAAWRAVERERERVLALAQGGNGSRWIQHSEVKELVTPKPTVTAAEFGPVVRAAVADKVWSDLQRLESLNVRQQVEDLRKTNNEAYLRRAARAAGELGRELWGIELTEEQCRAVGIGEDVTQVVAGAGSGKTSVLTAKAAHLERFNGVPAERILCLAYNRAAVEEVQRRLAQAGSAAAVRTFHSFGMEVIGEATGRKPSIAALAEDDAAFRKFIDDRLQDYLRDGERRSTTAALMFLTGLGEYESPFAYASLEEYEAAIRAGNYRALRGERVKSQDELALANYLALAGVEYQYERRYPHWSGDERHGLYKPDFYLPEREVWLEHFCLNERGDCPAGWAGYKESAAWKRRLHAEEGTTLRETYTWQFRQGLLEAAVAEILAEFDISGAPMAAEDLLEGLRADYSFSNAVKLLEQFLRHAKAGQLSMADLEASLYRKFGESGDLYRGILLLRVYGWLRADYEAALAADGGGDFQDLINEAGNQIAAGNWAGEYDYVLVDEYQDISHDRFRLLRELQRRGSRIFTVGDDWQSINRWAGSDVALFRNAERKEAAKLGYTEQMALRRTFRFNAGVAGLSGDFIMRNPAQTKRSVLPNEEVADGGVTLVFAPDIPQGLRLTHRDLAARGEERGQVSVKYLGRYNNLSQYCRDRDYSTVHRAKGLEADYSVVIGLEDRKMGFPSRIESDPLLEVAIPFLREKDYPLAEERRLLYVAMTRGRKGCYLVVDSQWPSAFALELLQLDPELRCLGEGPMLCPACGEGWISRSSSGKTAVCGSCGYRAPICAACGAGYVFVDKERGRGFCQKGDCGATSVLCPECREGVLSRSVGTEGGVYYWCSGGRSNCKINVGSCYFCREGCVDVLTRAKEQVAVCVNASCRREFDLCRKCRKGYLVPKEGKNGRFVGCTWWRHSGCKNSRDWSAAETARFGGALE